MSLRRSHDLAFRLRGCSLRGRLAWLTMMLLLCAVSVFGGLRAENAIDCVAGEAEDAPRESEEERVESESWTAPLARRRSPSPAAGFTPGRPVHKADDVREGLYMFARRHAEPAPGLANQLCARLRC